MQILQRAEEQVIRNERRAELLYVQSADNWVPACFHHNGAVCFDHWSGKWVGAQCYQVSEGSQHVQHRLFFESV